MQKTTRRSYITNAVLVSSLLVLAGCDFFKKTDCQSCVPSAANVSPGDVLLKIDGEPAITRQQFEDFYEIAQSSGGPMGAPSKEEAFNMLEMMVVLDKKLEREGTTRGADYQKRLSRAYDTARWGVNSQTVAEEIQKTIDVSGAAVERFYNDQKGQNQAFDRPPFQESPEGLMMQAIEFSTKKAADDFVAKAQADFAGAARDAGLSVKDLGRVTAQSQDVKYPVKLKARTMKPQAVEVVQVDDKHMVLKAGQKFPAKYAEYRDIVKLPQMKEMLQQFKQQTELEPAFMKLVDDFKQRLKLDRNDSYFAAMAEEEQAEDERLKQLFAQRMNEAGQEGDAAQTAGAVAA